MRFISYSIHISLTANSGNFRKFQFFTLVEGNSKVNKTNSNSYAYDWVCIDIINLRYYIKNIIYYITINALIEVLLISERDRCANSLLLMNL